MRGSGPALPSSSQDGFPNPDVGSGPEWDKGSDKAISEVLAKRSIRLSIQTFADDLLKTSLPSEVHCHQTKLMLKTGGSERSDFHFSISQLFKSSSKDFLAFKKKPKKINKRSE